MAGIRPPLIILAAVLVAVALALELGSRLWIASDLVVPANTPKPGMGIFSLAAVDVLLTVSMAIIASSAAKVPSQLVGRVSGFVTAIVSFLTVLGSLAMLFVAISLLLLMVGLLVSVPFGTAVYLGTWGHFPRGGAAITLGFLIILKLVALALFVLGDQSVLQSKLLLARFGTSIGLTWVVAWLHGLAPGFLVSITDTIGAIIGFIAGIVWAILSLVGGIMGILGNLKLGRRKPEDRYLSSTPQLDDPTPHWK